MSFSVSLNSDNVLGCLWSQFTIWADMDHMLPIYTVKHCKSVGGACKTTKLLSNSTEVVLVSYWLHSLTVSLCKTEKVKADFLCSLYQKYSCCNFLQPH